MHDMTHSYIWHDSFKCITWHTHMRDMTYTYVWHDSFICVTWLIHAHFRVWHDSFTLILVCDMTHSLSFICVTWLIYAHSRVWHDSFTLILVCDMTHSRSFSCVTWLIHAHSRVWHDSFTLIHMCDMTHLRVMYEKRMYESHTRVLYQSVWISHDTQMSMCMSNVWKPCVCKSHTSEVSVSVHEWHRCECVRVVYQSQWRMIQMTYIHHWLVLYDDCHTNDFDTSLV